MAELMIIGHQVKEGGSIQIAGSKNSSLALMAACLLTGETLTLKNVPKIGDVENMKNHLKSYGVRVSGQGTEGSPMTLNANQVGPQPFIDGDRQTIRAVTYGLGPLLARFGEAKVPLPGGCHIQEGGRPIDYHIQALVAMGAEVVPTQNNGWVQMVAPNGLEGADITFPGVSVGATVNTVMAASLANGQTIIRNASVEPEVIDLVDMLNNMGARINFSGPRDIVVNGSERNLLTGATHTVIPDRIEAGSYAIAAAINGGSLTLRMDPRKGEILNPLVQKLKEAGVSVDWTGAGLRVQRRGQLNAVNIVTGAYPEFPTDLLPQWVTLMTQAQGRSRIEDTIYNNRFAHVPALKKMGADIRSTDSDTVYHVTGASQLRGTRVRANDLRGGMALVLAALAAKGTTVIKDIEHVHRGYSNLIENLKQCGAMFHSVAQQLPAPRPGYHGGPGH